MSFQRKDLKHGDVSMYRSRGCRCDPCKHAHNESHKAWMAARGVPQVRKRKPSATKAGTGVIAVCTIPTAHLRNWR